MLLKVIFFCFSPFLSEVLSRYYVCCLKFLKASWNGKKEIKINVEKKERNIVKEAHTHTVTNGKTRNDTEQTNER